MSSNRPFVSSLTADNAVSKPLLIFWLAVLAACAAALFQARWDYVPIIIQGAPKLSWDAVRYNWGLAAQGKGTAADAAWGLIVFLGMSGCFSAAGGWLIKKILGGASAALMSETSAWERRVAGWLAGSWVLSTVWFALGTAGQFKAPIALGLAVAGIAFLMYCLPHAFRSLLEAIKNGALRPATVSAKLELGLGIALSIWILSYAAFVAFPQYYWDTLSLNMAVPGFYAAEGRFVPNPFHVYTYFAQHYELLCTWALLAGSKEAAFFLGWGHWAALILFVYGFLSRTASKTIAFLSVGIFLSTSLSPWLAFHIKNDLQVGLFLILQWWALRIAFDHFGKDGARCRRWLLLAGFFAGAAYSVKFIAVPCIAVTFIGVIAFYLAAPGRDGTPRWKAVALNAALFSAGGLLSAGPWLMRNAVLFKNPFYPFLNGLFGAEYIFPWHRHPMTSYRLLTTGASGLLDYARDFTQIRASGPYAEVPVWWGPTAILCIAALLCVTRAASRADRWVTVLALLCWPFTLLFAFKPITHLGPMLYVCMISFGLGLGILWKNAGKTWIKIFTGLIVAAGLAQGWIYSGVKSQVYISAMLLAGSSPMWHWIPSLQTDTQTLASIDEMEQLHGIVNKYSPEDDRVLFMGSVRPAGIRRRHVAAMSFAKQPMMFFAEQSKDEHELKDRLTAGGVRQIVLDVNGWDSWLKGDMVDDPHRHGISISGAEIEKIGRFMRRYAVPRFSTLSQKLVWFSIRPDESDAFPPIALDADDVYRYPASYLNMGAAYANSGREADALMIFRLMDAHAFTPEMTASVDHCLKVMSSGEKK